jgi:hypothetical protein
MSRAGDFSLGDHTRFPANTTIEVTKREFFKLSPESSFPSASNTPQVHSWQKLGESQHIQTNENTACTSRLSPVKELPGIQSFMVDQISAVAPSVFDGSINAVKGRGLVSTVFSQRRFQSNLWFGARSLGPWI